MELPFFFSFLQHIAVGVASVVALLLATWLGTPRRSLVAASRRTVN